MAEEAEDPSPRVGAWLPVLVEQMVNDTLVVTLSCGERRFTGVLLDCTKKYGQGGRERRGAAEPGGWDGGEAPRCPRCPPLCSPGMALREQSSCGERGLARGGVAVPVPSRCRRHPRLRQSPAGPSV